MPQLTGDFRPINRWRNRGAEYGGRTKGDSNRRYSSENISLRCRPNFRSCAAKWLGEKNPQKGAKIWFAPRSHSPVLGQRNGATMRFLSSGHFGCILRPFDRECPLSGVTRKTFAHTEFFSV